MLVFLDTEFTSLEEPYLISAGLVAVEKGVILHELYFEMAGISPLICNSFVQDNVLPHLEGKCVSVMKATKLVTDFIGNQPVTFFTDAPRYDLELIKPFLPGSFKIDYMVPSFDSEEEAEEYKLKYEACFDNGLRRHHALDDARAAYLTWKLWGNL